MHMLYSVYSYTYLRNVPLTVFPSFVDAKLELPVDSSKQTHNKNHMMLENYCDSMYTKIQRVFMGLYLDLLQLGHDGRDTYLQKNSRSVMTAVKVKYISHRKALSQAFSYRKAHSNT